ncbi:SDR family NAD(P)-dependent oxidoreductase [Segatella paludivivens]|uniref:SDR family NAD(P)-dependent oxidoreductase n=1 Tax=Segatella paludivivens TaxID=185294 RepID=UPI0003730B23|nr:SDR family oxidoreductase [Segatella paludivivens]
MDNPFSLFGKTILVTGASSGIGRAISIECSKMGARVIITGRNKLKLDETLSMMEGNLNKKVIADLTIEKEAEALVSQLPHLDGIVHNAGVGSRVLCKNINMINLTHDFLPNTYAPILFQALLLQHKVINKNSSIVFISSIGAKHPNIANSVYSASKGAIVSYAKCLGLELAPRKIRVNCVCPGMVWTDLIIQDGVTKEDLEVLQNKYALKRYGKPEDIAYLVLYLLSDASSWMTGNAIDISGGGEGILT